MRAVTLCGAGGIGKTRLALRLLAAIAAEFPDGAWFVELGELRQPEHVVAWVARSGRRARGAGPAAARHAGRLAAAPPGNARAGQLRAPGGRLRQHLPAAAGQLARPAGGRDQPGAAARRGRGRLAGAAACPAAALPATPTAWPSSAASTRSGCSPTRAAAATPGFTLGPANAGGRRRDLPGAGRAAARDRARGRLGPGAVRRADRGPA